MRKNTPLVSVIMPVFNAERTIATAVKSILTQSLKNFELIIIDDFSTDSTSKLIKSLKDKRIKLYRNPNRSGVAYSLNKGLKQARGTYIARMDADDIALRDRFKVQVNFLQKNKKISFVGSWAELISETGNTLTIKKTPIYYKDIKKRIFQFNPFIHPTIMFRSSAVKNKLYNEAFNGAEDYDLFLNLVRTHRSMNLPVVLLKYRISTHSVSYRNLKHMELQALKVRWNAITKYGYSLKNSLRLIRPILLYLVPTQIKHLILYGRS